MGDSFLSAYCIPGAVTDHDATWNWGSLSHHPSSFLFSFFLHFFLLTHLPTKVYRHVRHIVMNKEVKIKSSVK